MLKHLLSKICGALAATASLVATVTFAAPPPGVLDETHAAVRAVMAVQDEVTSGWMQQSEVLGTAVGLEATGNPALVVYVDRDAQNVADVIRSLPVSVRGVGVKIELTDKFVAMAKPGSGASH